MGKFYSLLTSVGIYEQNLSLPSYEMDLKLMENALIEGLRLSKDTIRTLGNSGIVKMRSFVRALMEFSSMIEEEDGFILYFSGHGCNGDLCFSGSTDGEYFIRIDCTKNLHSKEHFNFSMDEPGCYLTRDGLKIYLNKLERKFQTEVRYLKYVDYAVSFRRGIFLQMEHLAKAIEEGNANLYEPITIR